MGANVGLVSLQCLPLLGPHGRVVAVEPQPRCCEALAETIALNGVANLEVHRLALSDRAGRLALNLPDATNLGTATLEPGAAGADDGRVVEVRDGSAFLESLRIDGDYAVKIDVEGHEGKVLAGFASYFARRPPKGVVFESHAAQVPGRGFPPVPGVSTAERRRIQDFPDPQITHVASVRRGSSGRRPPGGDRFRRRAPDQAERLSGRRRRPLALTSDSARSPGAVCR